MKPSCRAIRWLPLLLALSPFVYAEGVPSGVLAETAFDFGTVKQSEHVRHAFIVRNTGSAPLRFEGAELSAPGMNVRFQPAEVAPGGEGTISVDWSTEHVAGAVAGEARIKWNDPAHARAVVSITGTVRPPIQIEPIPAVFLTAFAGERAERVLTITNNEEPALVLDHVESGANVTAEVSTVEPGKSFRLTVHPAQGLAPGEYQDSLTVYTNNPAQAKIELPVHLLVRTDVYAHPDAVDFGTVSLAGLKRPDATVPVQPILVKKGSGKFRITGIESDSPAFVITRAPADASDSFELSVKLRPESVQAGSLRGVIRVATDDSRFPEVRIPVTADIRQ